MERLGNANLTAIEACPLHSSPFSHLQSSHTLITLVVLKHRYCRSCCYLEQIKTRSCPFHEHHIPQNPQPCGFHNHLLSSLSCLPSYLPPTLSPLLRMHERRNYSNGNTIIFRKEAVREQSVAGQVNCAALQARHVRRIQPGKHSA